MSQQQDDTLPVQQDPNNAPTSRPVVPPYNPQNKSDTPQTTKTFMDYLKEYWWVIVAVLALIAFLVYWFCFRKSKTSNEPALLGGKGNVDNNTGNSNTSTSRSGKSSNTHSNANGNSAPKLNITNQRLSS